MKINDETKISELINANKDCIDAIASVAKPFKRLKNPILRKIMASRVSISEAAKMGGTTVDAIVAAIQPLGFVYEKSQTTTLKQDIKPQWLIQAKESTVIKFDVRPIIESGTDPLKTILGKFKEVPGGHILCIINSFVPTPLIHLLKQEKAEDSYVDMISPEESHTYFLKSKKINESANESSEKVIMDDEASFKALYNSFEQNKIKEIDVRNLEMPLPMQTILSELNNLSKGNVLYVNHKRVPLYLLEELTDKNYETHVYTIDENNVKLMLFEKN